jgi:hypothetical protein
VDRARQPGDLPRHPAGDVVADIVFGTIWYRVMATRRQLGAGLVDDPVATLAPSPQVRA